MPARKAKLAAPSPPRPGRTTAATPVPKGWANPLGTDGFEFVEFTAPDREGIDKLHRLLGLLGFTAVAKHRSKDVTL